MARSQEQNDRIRAANRRLWVMELRHIEAPVFTTNQASEVWGVEISNARHRLRECKRAGLVAVREAVFWPKPQPWGWVLTAKGRAA